jgi:glutamate-5-semialdehyde dehydrogenase
MTEAVEQLEAQGKAARAAAHRLAFLSTDIKNQSLNNIADYLLKHKKEILAANKRDYDAAKDTGMGDALLDRLMLDESRLQAIAADTRAVAALPDPVGEAFEKRTLPNGL